LFGRRLRYDEELAPGRRTLTDAEARRRDQYREWQAAAQARRLDDGVEQRMGRAFGHDFRGVVVHVDSPEARGTTKAVTQGDAIHFRDGAYQPGTSDGDWLRSMPTPR
jgi:hypothetical protein